MSAARAAAELNVHTFGMNLHAATTVDGRDRKQLERLSRYLLRPPFATDAITRLPEGRVRLDIARRGRSLVMSAEQFIAKLIAVIPPPGVPMVRYAEVFSNAHHLRTAVAPAPAGRPEQTEPAQTKLLTFSGRPVDTKNAGPATPSKIAWAQLLARVLRFDVLTCPRVGCGGKLRATAAVLQSREIALLLIRSSPCFNGGVCAPLRTSGALARARLAKKPIRIAYYAELAHVAPGDSAHRASAAP